MKQQATVIARNEAISELCQSGNWYIFLSKMQFLLAFVFCLFLSVNVSAQSKDTMVRMINSDTSAKSKPLMVVDGIIYNGDWKNINPGDILSVTVLKSPGATNIYGPQGANGAILIQTKNYKVPAYTSKSLDSVADKDALYVIDGIPSKNKLNGIGPKDILSVTVLKKLACDSCYINTGDHGAVLVATKQGAVKSYQKKFSSFSAKYKDYIKKHNGDDNNLVYILNGTPVQGKRDYIIGTLYNISPDKIKDLSFNQGEMDKEHDTAAVIINLKDVIVYIR